MISYGLRHAYVARPISGMGISYQWGTTPPANPASFYTAGSAPVATPASTILTPGPGAPGLLNPVTSPAPGTIASAIASSAAGTTSSAGVAPAICLNQAQNSVACSDPNCTWGDCGSTAPQITVGSLCLGPTTSDPNTSEAQVSCSDPSCTYGDCVSSSWWSASTIISGVPDVAIYGAGILLLLSLVGGGAYYARR